jgi:heterogeneous nuclear rnp K-like protein
MCNRNLLNKAHLLIAASQAPHDETGERMFTIMGTAKANESALFLLYENLEAEKMRRSQSQAPE